MERTFRIEGLKDLPAAAKWLLQEIGDQKHLAFEGEMGAGKTTFIQALCRELGVKQEVTSPTFALVNEYQASKGLIYHFDFYRIDDPIEALDFGLEDYLASGELCLMEWPGKIEVFLPEGVVRISIQVIDHQTRLLQLA